MSAQVRCDGVGVTLGDAEVLRGVSLSVDAGGWVTVVGPNGAGKSTLLRAVAGLVPATGLVEIAGHAVPDLPARKRARLVAVVPQNPMLPEGMRVLDYVMLGRHAHIPFFGREGPADLEVVHETVARLELDTLLGRPIGTLSGGERQRAVVARALVQQAPVLLLDEPTTALDVGHQQDVLELVDSLRRDAGLTVLMTMHDLTLAGQYADALVMLDAGKVVASGSPHEVLTAETIAAHYGARVRVLYDDGFPTVVPVRGAAVPATLTGGTP